MEGTTSLAYRLSGIRFNRLERRGNWWLKARRPGASLAIAVSNVVLRWGRFPIHFFLRPLDWQRHEIACYQLLYGPDHCRAAGVRSLEIRHLPGQTLRSLRLDSSLVRLAARELRRCHELEGWSHGDPHLGNLLYDGERCRLFDFDARHDPGLGAEARQADDLLILLLELSCRSSELLAPFLAEYACPDVQMSLARGFRIPGGMELILWQIRCAFESSRELQRCFQAVRNQLA